MGRYVTQGYGVVYGENGQFLPYLFEFCGNPQLDPCCQNVHNIQGPYFSCLVYSIRSLLPMDIKLKQQVLLNNGYEYFLNGNDQTRDENLGTSIDKMAYVQMSLRNFGRKRFGRKRTSLSQFLKLSLEWL